MNRKQILYVARREAPDTKDILNILSDNFDVCVVYSQREVEERMGARKFEGVFMSHVIMPNGKIIQEGSYYETALSIARTVREKSIPLVVMVDTPQQNTDFTALGAKVIEKPSFPDEYLKLADEVFKR